ncbi:MAG: DUF2730 family protein [Burkholderiales bacterium]|nr:DUF2730 family protein [Burkholderiales bacterium]
MLDFSDPRFWLDLAKWLIALAAVVAVWMRRPGEDAAKAVSQLEEEVTRTQHAMATRLTQIEERIAHMPTDDELERLIGTVKAIEARLTGLDSGQNTMRHQLNRIEDYLLKTKQ